MCIDCAHTGDSFTSFSIDFTQLTLDAQPHSSSDVMRPSTTANSSFSWVICCIGRTCWRLFILLKLAVLLSYVFVMWNCLMALELLSRKRDSWIWINDLRVVYEEAGLIVLNKHPNLLINDNRPWFHCLTLQMQLFFNRPRYASWNLKNMFHFVNRLDYATSGLICIACDQFTAHILGKTFSKHMVGKQYLACVWGHVGVHVVPPDPKAVRRVRQHVYLIQMALGATEHVWPCGRVQKLVAPATDPRSKNVRDCSTIAVVLEHGQIFGEPASRLLLIPLTGRRHQLRVHCAAGLGHSIVGDLSYSAWPFAIEPRGLRHNASLDHRLDRMMLHAYHLNLVIRSQREGALIHHHHDRKGFLYESLIDKHQVLDLCTGDPNFFCNTSCAWVIETQLHSLAEWQDIFTL